MKPNLQGKTLACTRELHLTCSLNRSTHLIFLNFLAEWPNVYLFPVTMTYIINQL